MGRWAVVMSCVGLAGCAPQATPTLSVPYDHLDDEHPGVVHLSSDCSGTLVGSRHVLTAGHCVAGEPSLEVLVRGRRQRVRRYASRCRFHPRAFGELRAEPCAVERRMPLRAWDLAILELDRAVPRSVATPHPIALREPAQLERVRLVAWFRHPFAIGTPRRYAGWNRVVESRGGLLTTLPDGDPEFSTRMGSSGGPALMGERVVGVLFGGERATSDDSIYVQTWAPPTARWLRRMLESPHASLPPGRALSRHALSRVHAGVR